MIMPWPEGTVTGLILLGQHHFLFPQCVHRTPKPQIPRGMSLAIDLRIVQLAIILEGVRSTREATRNVFSVGNLDT